MLHRFGVLNMCLVWWIEKILKKHVINLKIRDLFQNGLVISYKIYKLSWVAVTGFGSYKLYKLPLCVTGGPTPALASFGFDFFGQVMGTLYIIFVNHMLSIKEALVCDGQAMTLQTVSESFLLIIICQTFSWIKVKLGKGVGERGIFKEDSWLWIFVLVWNPVWD